MKIYYEKIRKNTKKYEKIRKTYEKKVVKSRNK